MGGHTGSINNGVPTGNVNNPRGAKPGTSDRETTYRDSEQYSPS